jgi:hypothetical protein
VNVEPSAGAAYLEWLVMGEGREDMCYGYGDLGLSREATRPGSLVVRETARHFALIGCATRTRKSQSRHAARAVALLSLCAHILLLFV